MGYRRGKLILVDGGTPVMKNIQKFNLNKLPLQINLQTEEEFQLILNTKKCEKSKTNLDYMINIRYLLAHKRL